jgi:integral membrane protein (TIGR01906 family)
MKKSFQIFFLIITILTPILLITSAMRTALSPIFVNIEYKLPNFPPDPFGFTNEERLHWANYSIKYMTGEVSEEKFSALQFPDGTPLFNEREVSHMIDVHDLTVSMLALWRILIIFFTITLFAGWKNNWLRALLHALEKGAKLTLVIIFGILVYVWVNFNQLFTLFHQIFFDSDSWLFYLSDTLIRLFPIKLWQDLFIFIGSFGIITSLMLIILGRSIDKKIEAQS